MERGSEQRLEVVLVLMPERGEGDAAAKSKVKMQTSRCRMADATVGRKFAVTGLQLAVKGKGSNGLCEKWGQVQD